jgi:hypothetical protein
VRKAITTRYLEPNFFLTSLLVSSTHPEKVEVTVKLCNMIDVAIEIQVRVSCRNKLSEGPGAGRAIAAARRGTQVLGK